MRGVSESELPIETPVSTGAEERRLPAGETKRREKPRACNVDAFEDTREVGSVTESMLL